MNIVSVVFTERDSGPTKHEQVVSMQNSCVTYTEDGYENFSFWEQLCGFKILPSSKKWYICTCKKKTCILTFTWHGGQFGGHEPLCANLLPRPRGKVEPPQLSEQRVIFIFWTSRFVVVRVVASKHIKVGVVSYAAMSAPGRGRSVTYRDRQQPIGDETTYSWKPQSVVRRGNPYWTS